MRALAADAGAAAASGAAGSGEGTPVAMRAEVKAGGAVRLRAFAVPEPTADAAAAPAAAAAGGDAWLRMAAGALCAQTRRYFKRPKAKPTAPADAEVLGASALAALGGIVQRLTAADESAAAAVAAEEDGSGNAASLHDTAARVAVGGVLASRTYGAQVVDLDELLHSQLPVDLHVRDADDVLQRTYRIEMLGALRVADKGAAPPTTRHDAARCHVDDWDYFLHEKAPRPATELLRCLRWLEKGSVDVLARAEVGADGAALEVTEALLERPFEAGVLRCTLTKVRTLAPPTRRPRRRARAPLGAAGARPRRLPPRGPARDVARHRAVWRRAAAGGGGEGRGAGRGRRRGSRGGGRVLVGCE